MYETPQGFCFVFAFSVLILMSGVVRLFTERVMRNKVVLFAISFPMISPYINVTRRFFPFDGC